MSTPEQPDPLALPLQPSHSFGPDHTAAPSTEDLVREKLAENGKLPPKQNQKTPPRGAQSVFKNLGQNKKPRSGVRKLDEKDREKIASLYVFAAMPLQAFKPKVAAAMAASADKCADAWMELAQENDTVRRTILMLIEGGVWGKVFIAHTPILLAALPSNFMPPMFQGVDLNSMMEDTDE
jgi:hypothetical protein